MRIIFTMHVQKLLKLLEQPATLSSKDVPALESLVEEYPYFYLANALLAKIVYVQEDDVTKHAVQRAATYATNRAHLRRWLENKLTPLPVTRNPSTKTIEETYAATNNYLEIIAKKSIKKSTNETSIKQFSTIDTILNKNLQFDPFTEATPIKEASSIDLSDRNTTLDDRFATEPLASLMIQQKKYKRAIEIYKYLMLKYPEKKPYFSNIISSINNTL